MSRKEIDLIGAVSGKLTVLSKSSKKYYWVCECECGNIVEVQTARIKNLITKSCGCLRVKHGMHGSPEYVSWNAMLSRCCNPNSQNYYKYGGAGIVVCDAWNPSKGGSFINFYNDMGERPIGTTLHRINSGSMYSKENCIWADNSTQSYDTHLRVDNTTGIQGVRYRKDRHKYESRISKDGKQIILYYGDSLDLAIKARIDAEKELYPNIELIREWL